MCIGFRSGSKGSQEGSKVWKASDCTEKRISFSWMVHEENRRKTDNSKEEGKEKSDVVCTLEVPKSNLYVARAVLG